MCGEKKLFLFPLGNLKLLPSLLLLNNIIKRKREKENVAEVVIVNNYI